MQNRECKWPMGKMLGGSSGMNYMLYVRGARGDYDGWARTLGDQRWSYDNLLPYFKKAEGMSSSRYVSDTANHNRMGPLKVRDSVFLTPLAAIYKRIMRGRGLPTDDL